MTDISIEPVVTRKPCGAPRKDRCIHGHRFNTKNTFSWERTQIVKGKAYRYTVRKCAACQAERQREKYKKVEFRKVRRKDFEQANGMSFAALLKLAGEEKSVALLTERVHRTTVSNWKSGRFNPPKWAIELLRGAERSCR